MKSALFVDFDNVYSGLRKLDQTVADRFAFQPVQWMNWIVDSLGLPDHVPRDSRRRILVRRCYLNPQAYQRFRPSFNLAGFEIIDCPALTGEGKTSTDIHMVLDIIELLQHETRYDEFIVLSADADFTPVLRKLRRWDRRTTVLAIGFPSAAYRASADLLIDQDEFVRKALGFQDDDEPQATAVATPSGRELADKALALVRHTVAEAAAPVPLARLAAIVLASVDGIEAETWAGFANFRKLVESWNLTPLKVTWDGGGYVIDPRRHATPVAAPAAVAGAVDQELRAIAELIRSEVAQSPQPVPCARLATTITSRHSAIAADWNGKGMFRKFIESLNLAPLTFDWSDSGGCIYDPSRHELKPAKVQSANWGAAEEIRAIATRIHEVTGAPLLKPAGFRVLFDTIRADLAEHAFDLKETGKRVRDRCRDAGHPVSRLDVNWILRGLLLRGHQFGGGDDGIQTLCRKTAENVRSLCLREQIVLDRATEAAIVRWIESGV